MLKNKNEEIVKLEDQKIRDFGIKNRWKTMQKDMQEKDITINKYKIQI